MNMTTKKAPKYYEPRIEKVEVTPEMRKEILTPAPGYPVYTAIGKTILYSAEAIRKVFLHTSEKMNPVPQMVNKIVWEAIMQWHNAKNPPVEASDQPELAQKPAAKKTEVKKKGAVNRSKNDKKDLGAKNSAPVICPLVRMNDETAIDFAARKNEWKKKNQK